MSLRQATKEDPTVDNNSSSPELSSPPKSESSLPPSPTHPPRKKGDGPDAQPPISATIDGKSNERGVEKSHDVSVTSSSAKHVPAAPAKKSTRKKDNPSSANDPKSAKVKAKSTKPRTTSSTAKDATAAPSRKRVRNSDSSTADAKRAHASSRQTTITDLVGSAPQRQAEGATATTSVEVASAQNGKNEAISPTKTGPELSSTNNPNNNKNPTTAARTSGQNYDPIRSANRDLQLLDNPVKTAPVSPTPPRSANRASESPSILSLIDPPNVSNAPRTTLFSHVVNAQSNGDTVSPSSSSMTSTQIPQPSQPPASSPPKTVPNTNESDDQGRVCNPQPPPVSKKPAETGTGTGTGTGASSAAPSPKPARQKEAPPAANPPGNGLLSSALFGGPTSAPSGDAKEVRAPTIMIHIPLMGETNKVVNFAKLAEEQYGFNALHPRLAAQRERMATVAAAGAALERIAGVGSADEMSLDLSEPEKDVEMGGMSGADGGDKNTTAKKKRKMKSDEYDKDDPFVDDSEMLWEEQAAASKDGFFVYSGPLVPVGEKPVIERADGTTAKRGRGRARGGGGARSGAGRGGAASGSGATGKATTTIRKSRMTKADRAKMEEEKQEREKVMLMSAKPSAQVA